MLPSEMVLMAHGWPRKTSNNSSNGNGNGSSSRGSSSGDLIEEEYYLPGMVRCVVWLKGFGITALGYQAVGGLAMESKQQQ